MPQLLSYTIPPGAIPQAITEVWIANKLQRSVKVQKITDAAGLEAISLTLLYPLRDYLAHPCKENDRVIVYINRRYHPDPMFRGYVTGIGDQFTTKAGQYVEVFALDDLRLLNTDCCFRDYNLKTTRDSYSERLSIRQIASDISRQIRYVLGSQAPQIAIYRFPNDFPGELKLAGVPFDSALSQLLEHGGDYKYFVKRRYTQTYTWVDIFQIGQGEYFDIVRGTDLTKGPRAQPRGVANAGEIRREENYVDIVNKAVVVGDRQIMETALPLTGAWNVSKEFMLTDLNIYSKKGTQDSPNPDYDPEAERLGRVYVFGKVDAGTPGPEISGYSDAFSISEYPDLESRLLSAPPFDYPGSGDDNAKPFVVYQFAGEATLNVTTDVEISDNEVKTAKPLTRENLTATGTISPEIATSVYLEAAYKLRVPLTVQIARQGAAHRGITRHFNRTEFGYKYQSQYYSLAQSDAHYDAGLAATVQALIATYNVGPEFIQNDVATATAWGQRKLKGTQDVKLEITYELPRMDLHVKVGQRIRENGTVLDANVFSVEYDIENGLTTLTAVSR